MRTLWVVAVVAIAIGSLMPANFPWLAAFTQLNLDDKVLHFAVYAAAASMVRWVESRTTAFAACSGIVALGFILELLQDAIPGRCSEALDALANCLGVYCGSTLSGAILMCWRRPRWAAAPPLALPQSALPAAAPSVNHLESLLHLATHVGDGRTTQAPAVSDENLKINR